jgi:hypothetical protein
VRLPVFLSRRPEEPVDKELLAFHHQLLAVVGSSGMRTGGEWQLLDCTGWPDNPTHENLIAWSWTTDSSRHLVVVNLSEQPAQGRVRLPWTDLRGGPRQLTELLTDLTYARDGDELVDPGLYVELEGLRWHLVAVMP